MEVHVSAGYLWRGGQHCAWVRHEFELVDVDWERAECGASVVPFYAALCGAQPGYTSLKKRFVPEPGHPMQEGGEPRSICRSCYPKEES
jgi:hypothetical protein